MSSKTSICVLCLTASLYTQGCTELVSKSCSMSSPCNMGYVCRGSYCMSEQSIALSTSMQREVVQPSSQLYVDSTTNESYLWNRTNGVYIGGSISSNRVLLKFPKQNWNPASIVKAYLMFERAIGAQQNAESVRLRIERIVEPWSERGELRTTWENPPASEPLLSIKNAYVSTQGPKLIRIDVTEFAKELAQRFEHAWGLRIEGESNGYGLAIATGSDGQQRGPYLEVFIQ